MMSNAVGISPTYTLRLRPDLRSLGYARLVLRRTLPELDETTDSLFYGAVTEIISNAINAQTAAAMGGQVQVRVQTTGAPVIQVSDTGSGFDPENPPTGGGSGFGLQIARSVCPGITIDSSDSGTTVTLPYPGSQPHPGSRPSPGPQ